MGVEWDFIGGLPQPYMALLTLSWRRLEPKLLLSAATTTTDHSVASSVFKSVRGTSSSILMVT